MRQKPQPIPQPRSPTTHRKQPHTPLPHHRSHRRPGHTRSRPHRGARQHDRTSRHHPRRPHPTILKHTFGFLRHTNNIQCRRLRDRCHRLNPRPTRTLQPHIRHRQPLLTHKPKLRRHHRPRPLSQQILPIRHPACHQMRKRMPNNLTRGDPPGCAGAGQPLKTPNLPLVRASQSNIAGLAKAEQRHGGGRRRAEIQQRLPEPRIHRQLRQPGRHLRIRRPNRRQRGRGLRKRGGRRLVQQWKLRRRSTPTRQQEGKLRQIGRPNLRLSMRRKMRIIRPRIAANHRPRALPAGTTRPLHRTRLATTHRDQAIHAVQGVALGHPGQARVNNGAHTRHRHRRLRHIGGHNNAGPGMPQRPILLSRGLAAMERKHRHIRDPPQLGAARGNVPHPRKKHQSRIHVRVLGGDSGHARHKLRPTPRPTGQRLIPLRYRKHLGRGRDHRRPQQRGKPFGIRGGGHGNHSKLRA